MANKKRIISWFLCAMLFAQLFPLTYAEESAVFLEEPNEESIISETLMGEISAPQAMESLGEESIKESSEGLAEQEKEKLSSDSLAGEDLETDNRTEPQSSIEEAPQETEEHNKSTAPICVRFICDPEETIVTVYDPAQLDENGEPLMIEPAEDGSWLLLPGVYFYDAECEGYEPARNEIFSVGAESINGSQIVNIGLSSTDNTKIKTGTPAVKATSITALSSTKNSGLSNAEITSRMDGLQSKYPNDSYLGYIEFGGGWECYAFARMVANDIFGSYPGSDWQFSNGYTDSNGWTFLSDPSQISFVEPGDVIRADGHSAIVWKIIGSTIYVAQAWGSQNNRVNWGTFWGTNNLPTLSDILSTSFVGIWKHPNSSSACKPIATLDEASGGAGTITVRGWAFDRDALSAAVPIHVYVGGPAGSGAKGYEIFADAGREDVDAAFPGVGIHHGFDSTITVSERGTQTLYFYACDLGSDLGNDQFATATVTISEPENKYFSITYKKDSGDQTVQYPASEKAQVSTIYDKRSNAYFIGYSYSPNATMFDVRPWDYIDLTDDITLYPVYISHAEATSGEPALIFNINDFTAPGYTITPTTKSVTLSAEVSGWGAWSDWSTSAVSGSDTTQVETRTVYPYYYFYCTNCGTGARYPYWGSNLRCDICGKTGTRPLEANAVDWFTNPWSDSVQWGSDTTKHYQYINGEIWWNWTDGEPQTQYRSRQLETSTQTRTVTCDAYIITPEAPITYTVAYDANGGSGAPASQSKIKGQALTLSATTPTRASSSAGSFTVTLNANGGSISQTSLSAARTTSYTFKNWNTAANGSGTTYNAGASYTADEPATLYAQWNSSTTTAAVNLPSPTRSGYTFQGWATNSGATSGVTGSYTPDGNVTLYAIWKENSIPADPNTPQISISNAKGMVGSSVTLDVIMSGNTGFVNASMVVSYSTRALKLKSIETDNCLLSGATTNTANGRVSFASATSIADNGILFRMQFEIIESAAAGDYEVNLTVNSMRSESGGKLSPVVQAGKVSVFDYILGDVDGDGYVDSWDASLLLRYEAGLIDESTINLSAADVDGDGFVDSWDASLILRYEAGLIDQLPPA